MYEISLAGASQRGFHHGAGFGIREQEALKHREFIVTQQLIDLLFKNVRFDEFHGSIGRQWLVWCLSLSVPRIHDFSAQVCKMLDVSGCERRTAGDYYSGDLRVAHVDGSAIASSFGREARCSFGR